MTGSEGDGISGPKSSLSSVHNIVIYDLVGHSLGLREEDTTHRIVMDTGVSVFREIGRQSLEHTMHRPEILALLNI